MRSKHLIQQVSISDLEIYLWPGFVETEVVKTDPIKFNKHMIQSILLLGEKIQGWSKCKDMHK